MKSLLPLCLLAVSFPLALTGCNRSGDMGSSSADTNAPASDAAPATASTDTNMAPAAASTDTNMSPSMPGMTSTPAAASTTDTNAAPAAPSTNSGM
jgi:hypothetical protein